MDESGKDGFWKDIKLPHSWAAGMTKRVVDFPSKEGPAFGIEYTIPLDRIERDRIKLYVGIEIPPHVQNIVFLDLAPQESLPRKQRMIGSKRLGIFPSDTTKITRSLQGSELVEKITAVFNFDRLVDSERRKTLEDMLHDLFGGNTEIKNKFSLILKGSKGTDIVLVCGHGGGDPYVIGEQFNTQVLDTKGHPIRKKGNDVPIEALLDRYNNSQQHAAILLHSCYTGNHGISAINVPLVYSKGLIGGMKSVLGYTNTRMSLPKV